MWLYNNYSVLPRFTKTAKNHKTWAKISAWENEEQYQETFVWLANLYMNMFEWTGLPDTCNELALEKTLFFYGRALFFRDDEPFSKSKYPFISDTDKSSAFWHTPVQLTEGLNIYYESINRKAYSYNYEKNFTITNSVLIRDNRMMFPPYITTMIYAQKLTDASRSIDVLTEQMKYPTIVEGDENDLASIERFFDRIRRNEGAIITVPGFIDGRFKVSPTASTGQGQNLVSLWDHKHELFNEYSTRRGIDNANQDKKERLVVAEAGANDHLINLSGQIMLDARKLAAEQINEMFGLSVSVDWRHPIEKNMEGNDYGFNNGLDTVQGKSNSTDL